MNFLWILAGMFAAAIVYMLIGALWYSPFLFGTLWQKLSALHIDPTSEQFKKDMQRAMILSPLSALLIAAVMICFMVRMNIHTVISGGLFGFTVWAGFIVPFALQAVIYSKKPFKLYLINIGYDFCCLVVMGALLTFFI